MSCTLDVRLAPKCPGRKRCAVPLTPAASSRFLVWSEMKCPVSTGAGVFHREWRVAGRGAANRPPPYRISEKGGDSEDVEAPLQALSAGLSGTGETTNLTSPTVIEPNSPALIFTRWPRLCWMHNYFLVCLIIEGVLWNLLLCSLTELLTYS